MSKIILIPKEQPEVPIEANNITPDEFAGKSLDEIKKIKIWYGNSEVPLADFFEVSGESGATALDTTIVIDGDVFNTKRIGQEMSAGEIIVNGNVNMYVGAEMTGGKITVEGNAASWAGQNMKGGELTIKGDAGDYVGSAYRGDWRGMDGGVLTVYGNVGNEIAEFMLNGKIIIKGNANIMPGIRMHGGLLVIEGDVVARTGAAMKYGNIVVEGTISEFLPGFEYQGIVKDIEIDGTSFKGAYYKFTGDNCNRGADGAIYASVLNNRHILP